MISDGVNLPILNIVVICQSLIYFGDRMHAKIGDIFLIPMMITGKLLIITAKKKLIKLI